MPSVHCQTQPQSLIYSRQLRQTAMLHVEEATITAAKQIVFLLLQADKKRPKSYRNITIRPCPAMGKYILYFIKKYFGVKTV